MLDFLKINYSNPRKNVFEIYPKFTMKTSKDLMIRGSDFYAIWNEDEKLWSTDEEVACALIDKEIDIFYAEHKNDFDGTVKVLHMWDADSGMIDKWHRYVQKQMWDNYHQLDEKLIFSNTDVTKEDYASHRLNYPLEAGDISAWDKMMSTLYSPEERKKIEWAIGAVVSGDSKNIQKFLVMYGAAGTGKSTVLNVIQDLFDGYYSVFDAKALGSASHAFALEAFKTNPLVAIQHDGDLSRIEDNTRLNSVVSHELMTVNEKFKSTYQNRFKCFLFMGTNKPVKITDAKSGILRRLIDVSPTGNKLSPRVYKSTMNEIKFELGAIAQHCLEVYLEEPDAYDNYIPLNMMGASNDFYNFVFDSYDDFRERDGISLTSAWDMYKLYCDDAKLLYPFSKRVFQEELKNYFENFDERKVMSDGTRVRSYYSGFLASKFEIQPKEKEPVAEQYVIDFKETESVLDAYLSDMPAQYANEYETPTQKWDDISSKLKDLDTSQTHYVLVPENMIVIDFDLKDEDGNKSFERNLVEASKWPKTYAELSKSGNGIHLHYIYNGDVDNLSRVYAEDIEIKVFKGKSSLRRRLSKCNDIDISQITSGLPLKGDKKTKVVNGGTIKSERGLRSLIERNLRKEIHDSTKPSVDFIFAILEDAYKNKELHYDVTDMRPSILAFAASSSHQADYCIKKVSEMKFKSEEASKDSEFDNEALVFFDCEVYPNLFIIVWKTELSSPVKMINPTPEQVEDLVRYRLVGFNCNRYDNHILYARIMGYTNEQLFNLSQRIISKSKNSMFTEAYNLSYVDVYDMCSKKQSLKKWEIELGVPHQEMDIPWDQPVDESLWEKVADYCVNDVVATQAVFEARKADFDARLILADISGLSVNHSTNQHTTQIVFRNVARPQGQFVYTDLSKMFPGYSFDAGKSTYRGEVTGEGGYVYAEPGIYEDVALLDIASMHPTSIEVLNLFGPYTKNFSAIKKARILIKHKEFDKAGKMFDGKLAKYLNSEEEADALAYALKIAINSVYGLTAATFDNKFRDPRNKDNIVAKRGALFMIDLKHAVQEQGFTVVHIKTDSIKIANATPEIIQFVMDFGKKYGYTFEHEATYSKICLVNDAVYIAQYKDGKHAGEWTATGAQFQVPYVFKTLFSKEPLIFDDYCESKAVTTSLYLDFNEDCPEDEHHYYFIGKVGKFCPIKKGCGGGLLMREKDGKYSFATGSKGFRWLEAETVKALGKEDDIDIRYYAKLVDAAVASISEYGDFEKFVNND